MTRPEPPFNFYDQDKPIFVPVLPAAKITGSIINSSIVCEGSMIEDADLRQCHRASFGNQIKQTLQTFRVLMLLKQNAGMGMDWE